MSEETVDLVALMNMRARTYGLLANLFREEVDADSLRELQAMRFPTATRRWTKGTICCTTI